MAIDVNKPSSSDYPTKLTSAASPPPCRDHQHNKNQTIPTITTQAQAINISHVFPNSSDDNDQAFDSASVFYQENSLHPSNIHLVLPPLIKIQHKIKPLIRSLSIKIRLHPSKIHPVLPPPIKIYHIPRPFSIKIRLHSSKIHPVLPPQNPTRPIKIKMTGTR